MNISKFKKLSLILFLSLVLLSFPSFCKAWWEAVFALPMMIIGAILAGLMALTSGGLKLASWLLDWILSPGFIGLSYTNPYKNPLIGAAWPIVRDFANIFILICLIIIGLVIALRLRTGPFVEVILQNFTDEEAKKVLPWLIIIALLINFTPVFCGIIVDFSNIAMNFFLHGEKGERVIGGSLFTNHFLLISSPLKSIFMGGGWKALEENLNLIVGATMVIIFNMVGIIILGGFCLLFFIRYLAIWLLVIFSPIAFAFWILPLTRKWFETWWNQFLQWCFIGIIGAFFLWLSAQTLSALLPKSPSPINIPIASAETPKGILGNALPYLGAMIMLFIGFVLSFTTSAMGAQALTTAIKGASVRAMKWPGKKGGEMIRELKPFVKAEEKIRKGLERVGILKKGAYEREWQKEKEEQKKVLERASTEELRKIALGPARSRTAMIKQEVALEMLRDKGKLKEEELKKVKELKLSESSFLKRRPDLAYIFNKTPAEILEDMDPEEKRKKLQPEALRTLEVFAAMRGRDFKEIGENGTGAQVEAIKKFIEKDLENEYKKLMEAAKRGVEGAKEKADKLIKNWVEIGEDPNFA
jgi:hypothetical protein